MSWAKKGERFKIIPDEAKRFSHWGTYKDGLYYPINPNDYLDEIWECTNDLYPILKIQRLNISGTFSAPRDETIFRKISLNYNKYWVKLNE